MKSKPKKYFNKKNNREGRCAGYGICYRCLVHGFDKCHCNDSPYNKPCLEISTLKRKMNEGTMEEYYLYFCANCIDRGTHAIDNGADAMDLAEPLSQSEWDGL